MSRIISASLSPNTEFDDVWLALRLLFTPWMWKRGSAIGKVETWFREYVHAGTAVTFNSGRSAQLAILKAFNIGQGSEVIIQAFTCVAVPNSIRWVGAKPIFADIDDSYNIDPIDLERKITPRTKAVIVQHTFGIPADMQAILPITRKHKLLLIEDCAHSLGATYKNKRIGTFGDAAFFSFGRDKVLSSVFGGLASIKDSHTVACEKLKIYHKKLNSPSFFWIFQQLFHPVAFSIILPLYRLGVGKAMLVILQRLRLLSFPVYPEEKVGRQPDDFPAKYPNALAVLLLTQLKKLERYNSRRRQTVRLYVGKDQVEQGAIYLRYPMHVDNPDIVFERAKKMGILLGNWYHNVIDPSGVGMEIIKYTKGSCPNAEETAKHIINLPTMISEKEARRVIAAL